MSKTLEPIDILRLAGRRLYGERWQAPLARALASYNPRQPRGMYAGNLWNMDRELQPVPAWIPFALVEIAREAVREDLETLELLEQATIMGSS